jgi:hypothetical protein
MHKRFAFIVIVAALFPLAGCRSGCQNGQGQVFKTQGQIILGHTERLTLCPDGRFVMEVESDVQEVRRIGVLSMPVEQIDYGIYTVEDSDISDFDARIRLVFEDAADFRRAYYRFSTESGVYLIEESAVKDLKVGPEDNWAGALKLR